MSLIINEYKDNTDRCWYDSSNILYSECYDHENTYKDLKVVFKDGRTYLYKKLIVQDYLLFRSHESQGKALNKYITCKNILTGKPKYEFERLERVNLDDIEKDKKILLESKENEE